MINWYDNLDGKPDKQSKRAKFLLITYYIVLIIILAFILKDLIELFNLN